MKEERILLAGPTSFSSPALSALYFLSLSLPVTLLSLSCCHYLFPLLVFALSFSPLSPSPSLSLTWLGFLFLSKAGPDIFLQLSERRGFQRLKVDLYLVWVGVLERWLS